MRNVFPLSALFVLTRNALGLGIGSGSANPVGAGPDTALLETLLVCFQPDSSFQPGQGYDVGLVIENLLQIIRHTQGHCDNHDSPLSTATSDTSPRSEPNFGPFGGAEMAPLTDFPMGNSGFSPRSYTGSQPDPLASGSASWGAAQYMPEMNSFLASSLDNSLLESHTGPEQPSYMSPFLIPESVGIPEVPVGVSGILSCAGDTYRTSDGGQSSDVPGRVHDPPKPGTSRQTKKRTRIPQSWGDRL